ncbi:MAG: polysaccharide deacetylase family protein [Hydrogenibacillus schlegelii]|uniref:Polysaccharide deacetylase family protein n=1 Tax=Hydrogenibacillus schlegelii TaxID=1484 RepID=A0A947CYL1_HYDSH|nr:polysaccharide deacetylase family protein [Hydrogenibacillus schlegelii]
MLAPVVLILPCLILGPPAAAGFSGAPPSGGDAHPVYYQDKVAVLMFHHLDETFRSPVTITPRQFEDDLAMLKAKGYHVISMEQFRAWLEGKAPVPPNAVLLTFDDGYDSFRTIAVPLLKKYGMTATNFLIVSFAERPRRSAALSYLDWQAIENLYREGFDFYSHTYNMHDLVMVRGCPHPCGSALTHRRYLSDRHRMETTQAYRRRIQEDLFAAKQALEQHLSAGERRHEERFFAYPYGETNADVVAVLKELGYRWMFTTRPGLVTRTSDPVRLPRINAGAPDITAENLEERLRSLAGRHPALP